MPCRSWGRILASPWYGCDQPPRKLDCVLYDESQACKCPCANVLGFVSHDLFRLHHHKVRSGVRFQGSGGLGPPAIMLKVQDMVSDAAGV